MNKKIKYILIAAIIMISILAINYFRNENLGDSSNKEIDIKIIIEDENILDESFETNASTLEELLLELDENDNIELKYSNSEYGMYIQGMGVDELFEEDTSQSKYWTYSSENNKICLESGFCPAASALAIEDGDSFIFELSKYE